MTLSSELKALGWALLASSLSLGGAFLTATAIKACSTPSRISQTLSPEIVVSPELVVQGREFYGISCSHCHGDDATGDEGPNLHNLSISNARIATTIKMGIKGEMPSFLKKYNDPQIAALVSYLRSLR